MKWYEKVAKAGKTFVKGVVDVTHVALDVAGCIPGIGVIPDLINGGIYALEGDGVNMLFSLAVAAPIIGDSVAIGKLAKRADGAVSAAVGMAKGLRNLPELEKVKPLVKILKRKLDKLFDFLDFSDELRSLMTKMLSKISGLMKEGGKLLNKFGKKLKQQLIKLKNKIKNLLKKDPKGNGKVNEGWDMLEGGGNINGREYSQHAMERMAPNTSSVRAELSRRAEKAAESKGLKVGSQEYYEYCRKYVDPRNIPPTVIEDAINNTSAAVGKYPDTFIHETDSVKIIVNSSGKVITVIPK